jgi:hypothetical protein
MTLAGEPPAGERHAGAASGTGPSTTGAVLRFVMGEWVVSGMSRAHGATALAVADVRA